MHKRSITYTDFNGDVVTDVYYFNLTKTEIVELEVEFEGGLEAAIQRMVESRDQKNLFTEFKRLILLAYGEKSDDGKRFIKNDELREQFSQSAAYDALFVELVTVENAAADFIIGVVPQDLVQKQDQDKPTGPPPLPNPTAAPEVTNG